MYILESMLNNAIDLSILLYFKRACALWILFLINLRVCPTYFWLHLKKGEEGPKIVSLSLIITPIGNDEYGTLCTLMSNTGYGYKRSLFDKTRIKRCCNFWTVIQFYPTCWMCTQTNVFKFLSICRMNWNCTVALDEDWWCWIAV